METTVRTKIKDGTRIIIDDKNFQLRKEIWKTIFREKGDLSDCDVAMALGIAQYELIHHTK